MTPGLVSRAWWGAILAVVLVAGATGVAPDQRGSRRGGEPIRSQVVGFSPGAFVLDLSPAELAADLDAMADLGARWVRVDVDWSRIEPTEGVHDWSTTDAVIAAARARDLEVLALVTYTPSWARPGGTTDKHPPRDADDFGRFAAAAVDRYHRRGVSTWEIWNEPNSEQFWSTGPDPEGYGELLMATSAAIRAADPSATVITGGLAPAEDIDGVELSPRTFLSRLYDVVPREAFDAVAVHPYSYPAFPSEGQGWNTFAALPSLRRILVDSGDEAKRIWLTEYGAPTGDHPRAVTTEHQAELVLDAVKTADRWDWVGPLFVYSHRDLPGGAGDDPEANFGLRYADGRWKPAWPALTALLAGGGGHAGEAAQPGP